MTTLPKQIIRVAKAQDATIRLRIFAEEEVELAENALAAATSLTCRPLKAALSSGDKLLFGDNVVLTLSGAVAAGATTVPLVGSPLPGPLKAGDVGRKLQDLTGYTVAMEVLTRREDATPLIDLSGGDVTLATQTGDDRGHVDLALVAGDTSSLDTGNYYAAAWRRNAGSSRPLGEYEFIIEPRGFLS